MLNTEKFDFMFSFAGEDRDVVHEVYNKLTKDGFRVFYDNAYQSQLVGQDLYSGLRKLYSTKGKYVVCFISDNYTQKVWTNLEFTAIKERLMNSFFASDFLIPILIGNTKMLDDIPTFIGFYKHNSVDKTVKILKEKIGSCTPEINLTVNINNCITYFCSQIIQILQAHGGNVKLSDTDKIIVEHGNFSECYLFSQDSIAQTPCIQVIKGMQESYDNFPSLIITWKKCGGLTFSVHNFDGDDSGSMKNISLNDTIKCLAGIIEKNIR